MALLELSKVGHLPALLLLPLLALEEATTHALVHDTQPKFAGRFYLAHDIVVRPLFLRQEQGLKELYVIHYCLF